MARCSMCGAIWLVAFWVIIASAASFTSAQAPVKDSVLDLKPIEMKPEPVGELHPALQWLKAKRVRGIWLGGHGGTLFDTYGTGDKTKGRVLADAGFNLIVLYSPVPSPKNIAEAHRHGMKLMGKVQYGTSHQEPYRRYREPSGKLHKRTCCPLDHDYIERHVGRWAVKSAESGADGFVLDTEMYGSDATQYHGPCTCDDCFATYLKQYAGNWQSIYEQIAPQRRGAWLGKYDPPEHYGRHQATRIEAQYDALRARCQAINPAFLFGYAPALENPPHDIPGLARGLGTSSHPCLVFSEREYVIGFTHHSLGNIHRVVRDGLPALYLSGDFLAVQAPDMLADNALSGSLYGGGWWAWYGGAIVKNVGLDKPAAFKPPYGRVSGTTAADYLNRLARMHAQLDDLLTRPQKDWPKPHWMK